LFAAGLKVQTADGPKAVEADPYIDLSDAPDDIEAPDMNEALEKLIDEVNANVAGYDRPTATLKKKKVTDALAALDASALAVLKNNAQEAIKKLDLRLEVIVLQEQAVWIRDKVTALSVVAPDSPDAAPFKHFPS